jgi:hypothetical protein
MREVYRFIAMKRYSNRTDSARVMSAAHHLMPLRHKAGAASCSILSFSHEVVPPCRIVLSR